MGIAQYPTGTYPSFARAQAAAISLAVGTPKKVTMDTAIIDASSGWDATNHRWTPQRAGYYQVSGQISFTSSATSAVGTLGCLIEKNGSAVMGNYFAVESTAAGVNADCSVSGLVLFNGSTDYLELWADPSAGTYTALDVAALVTRNLLSAFWVGGSS